MGRAAVRSIVDPMSHDAASELGWKSAVPPNGFSVRPSFDDEQASLTPKDRDWRNLAVGDPTCADWVRAYDDPHVSALREHLAAQNGIRGLEIVDPDDVERAVSLFYRDGFVAVRDALDPLQLARMKAATDRALDAIVTVDPDCSMGGGAGELPHRYSFGGSSATRHMLHVDEWVDLIDLATTTPILTAIFGSPNYIVMGGGGDVALPGAIEYQGLHSDETWAEPHDPTGRVTSQDLPVHAVTVNFTMTALTRLNGPIRQIPGSQTWRQPIPNLRDEPGWMKLSTVCPLPAGAAIFRDLRNWHGGTPNVSREVRAIPNIEYFAPWFRTETLVRSMPYEQWKRLSPHGQRISRYVMCNQGETVVGAGYVHPRKDMREVFKAQQLGQMGTAAADEYLRRL
jgi:ectoine hydroxylase-related dioxygenase (phytanoyl-CoA dioxygenase family)